MVKVMARGLKPVDISDNPGLLRLVREVQAEKETRVLRREGEDGALLVPVSPVGKRRSPHAKTQEDYEAFLPTAGGWSDVDTDKLIEDIYESRRLSPRPAREL